MATRTPNSQPGSMTQDNRVAKLDTPLGKDTLLISRFECSEGLSELFEIRIDVISEGEDIDFDRILGRVCSISLSTYNDVVRDYSGYLTDTQWVGLRNHTYAYRLILRPWLWLLSKNQNSRIFKDKTPLDIIRQVFKDAGFGDQYYKIKATGANEKLEYCVQYRESDYAFVSRLMEDYGLYFYFKHDGDRHVLHIADSIGGHDQLSIPTPQPGARRASDPMPLVVGPTVLFLDTSGEDRRQSEHLYEWTASRRFRTGRYEVRDYDYLQAKTKLKGEKESTERYEKARSFESYGYPGGFTKTEEGNRIARMLLDADQAQDHRMYSEGDAPSLHPGVLFRLQKHPTDDGEYLVVRAKHTYESQAYRSGGSTGTEGYTGAYELQEKFRPFKAPHVTPRPRIYGPQTAFVVGRESTAKSEEIDVDKHGRIFVDFHWNRGDRNRDCSRAVRIAQIWAGKGWGFQFIPRIGMEVVVEFLEGDPDQPLVTGCVYNSDFTYPWTLPDEKTKSGIKTDSSLNGAAKGHNQFRFEDKTGQEEINMRAEKDLNGVVQNKETREIGCNFKGTAESRLTTLVHGTDKLVVKDADWIQEVNQNWKNTVQMGNWTVDVSLGKIDISAMQSITLTVGQSKIVMDPVSISIESLQVKVDGTAMTEVKGGAMLTLKGGLTMIN